MSLKSLKGEILAVCKSATLLPKAFLSLTQSRVSSNIASALANSSLAHPICGGYCMATKSPKSFLRIITSRCNWATYPLLGQLVHQVVETVVFFSQKSGFWEPQIFEEQLSSVLWMRYRRSRLKCEFSLGPSIPACSACCPCGNQANWSQRGIRRYRGQPGKSHCQQDIPKVRN